MLRCRRQLRFIKGECERMYGVYETQLFCIPLQSHSKNIVCVVFLRHNTSKSVHLLVYNDFLTGKKTCIIVECDSLSLNPTVNYRAGIFSANMRHRHDHSKHCLCSGRRGKKQVSLWTERVPCTFFRSSFWQCCGIPRHICPTAILQGWSHLSRISIE